MNTIWEGVVIGAVGGGIAGLTVPLAAHFGRMGVDALDRRRIHQWLLQETSDKDGHRFRSTRAIASWNDVTLDRARYLCSIDERIFLSTGPSEQELWSLYDHRDTSV